MLDRMPEERVIDRKSLEYRLEETQKKLNAIKDYEKIKPIRPRLTFSGEPVLSSRGALADFLPGAFRTFIGATYAVAASLTGKPLHKTGPLPDRGKHPVLIIGPAIGSFGFEMEIVKPEEMASPSEGRQLELFDFEDSSAIERSIKIIIELFKRSAHDTNEAVAEIVEQIDSRAIKSVEKFLTYTTKHNAYCALSVDKDVKFRYRDIESINRSKKILSSSNFQMSRESFAGCFIGVLPKARRFEFRVSDTKEVLRGKILDAAPEEIEEFARTHLYSDISVEMGVYRVGDSNPRYSLDTVHILTTPP
jgi:hypothetical protein